MNFSYFRFYIPPLSVWVCGKKGFWFRFAIGQSETSLGKVDNQTC